MLSAVLIVAITIAAAQAQTFWTSDVTSIDERRLESFYNGAARSAITFTLQGTLFDQKMGTDRFVFPHSCNSSSSQNPFGWEKFKELIVYSVGVTARQGRTRVEMTFQPHAGFTVTFDEVIRCGKGFVNADGDSYRTSGAELSTEARNFAFTIKAFNAVTLKILNDRKYVVASGFDGRAGTSGNLPETYIRSNGFLIYLMLEADAWNAALFSTIAGSLSCTSFDTHGCDWFYRLTNDTSRVYIPADSPNVVIINATRSYTRTFNIDNDLQIAMHVPKTTNFTLGLKPPSVEWRLFPSQTQFIIKSEAVSPEVIFATTTVTEACLRGRRDMDPNCTMRWVVNMKRHATIDFRFIVTPNGITDMREIAFTSAALGPVNPVSLISNGGTSNNDPYILIINTRAMFEYEITADDTLTLQLPFSIFNALEPPKASLSIRVTTSPGDIVGYLFDVGQNLLWRGGVIMRIGMGGESWPLSMNSSAALLQYSRGSIVSPVVGGWNMDSVRECLLPEGAVRFGRMESGRENFSELLLHFQPCPQFLMDGDETVTFSFPTNIGVSGHPIPVERQINLTFRIAKSPGEFTLRAPQVYEESDVVAGLARFSIVLLGEVWAMNLSTCYADFARTWTSNVAVTASDAAGWSSAASRAALLGTLSGYSAFNATTRNQLDVQFRANSVYDTRKGETITIGVPPSCLFSGSTIKAGDNRTNFTVVPQNGNVTVYFGVDPIPPATQPDIEVATLLSEGRVRNGGFYMLLVATGDTFETTRGDALRADILNGIVCEQSEPFGFTRKKLELILPWTITIVNLTAIKVPLQRNFKYDIKLNETINVIPQGAWMGSGRKPQNGTWDTGNCDGDLCPYSFTIYASAGSIEVDWFGQPNATVASSIRTVTEDDIRDGNVWFNFKLLGDQWRQERSAFRNMFVTPGVAQPFGLQSLSGRLVPSIEFFQFRTTADYEECFIRLQSSEAYDIDTNDAADMVLGERSMSSGIAPVFTLLGRETRAFPIAVVVSRGRAVLSGVSAGLNEKMVRNGGIKVFITLFGEKWTSATESEIINANVPILAGALGSQFAFETVVITASSGGRELILSFRKDEGFNIDRTETIEVLTPAALMRSGLEPIHSPFLIPIQATGGELVYKPPFEISEEDIRSGDVALELRLLGDEWDVQFIVSNFESFLDGLSSLSSSVQEPHGFFANRDVMVQGLQSLSVKLTSTEILLKRAPRYDIDADELLTFTITTTDVVTTRIMPDPNSITIRIRTRPRNIICIVAMDLPGVIVLGRYNTRLLQERIATMLLLEENRIEVSINGTEYRDDGYGIVVVRFLAATGSGITIGGQSERTSAELGDMLLSVRNDYLLKHLGVKWAYFADAPPPDAEIRDPAPTPAPPPPVEPTSKTELFAWIFGSLGFVVALVGAFAFSQYVKQGRLAGNSRRGNNAEGVQRYGARGDYTDIPEAVGELPPSLKKREEEAALHILPGMRVAPRSQPKAASPATASPQTVTAAAGAGGESPTGDAVAGEPDKFGALSTIRSSPPMRMKDFVRRKLGVSELTLTQDELNDVAEADGAGGVPLSRSGARALANSNSSVGHGGNSRVTKSEEGLAGRSGSERSGSSSASAGAAAAEEQQRLGALLQAAKERRAAGRPAYDSARTLENMMSMTL